MKGTKHIHGPYTQKGRIDMIMDLLSCPSEWSMECEQGITIIKFRTPKNVFNAEKAMCKLQDKIADYLNVPERKYNRDLYRNDKRKERGKE